MSPKRAATLVAGGAMAAVLTYLLAWPVPIDPAAWDPPEAPLLAGPYAVNEDLALARRIELADGVGPEDVAVDEVGRVYGGLLDGRIVRRPPGEGPWETFADTGGRPLGLAFDAQQNLIVADANAGLLEISRGGVVRTLATEANGRSFGFTDDVDVGPDGIIYFTDASSKFRFPDWRDDALEHRPHGRLLAFDPDSAEVTTLLDGLYFANGVAVDPAGDFALVNETWKYRVLRYWIRGPRAGQSETLIDNLPGFPDGISTGTGGIFWVALASPRNPQLDATAPHPWLRRLVRRLPEGLQPAPVRYAFILGIDREGRVQFNLQDPTPAVFAPITSVEEHEGALYFGSLEDSAIALIERPRR